MSEEIKIPFRSLLTPPEKFYAPSGEKEEEILALKVDKKGNEVFYVKGKTNVYDKIQSYLEETKIENIIMRAIDTGDDSILNQVEGMYADLTEMPTNIFEAAQKIKDAENIFNELPTEIKKKYEFNFNKYLQDFGSENWLENMKIKKEETKEEDEEEKKEEEKNE